MRIMNFTAWLVPAAALSLTIASAQAQDVLTYKGADRQQVLEEGARKEGQVILYSAAIVNQALRPLTAAFMKKYPYIKMTFWRGDTEEIAAKLSAETRADNIVADVVEGTGIGELAVSSGLTQPYWTPMIADYPEAYRDPKGLWTSTRISYFGMAYNTKQVADADAPKTYEDLLDPKWKGKLAWRIGTSSGTPLFITNLRLAWGEDKAMDYLKKLATQKVINFGSGSARTLVDRVIAGEFPVALNIFAHHPLISKAKGAPVASRLLDPTPSSAGTRILPKTVHHPYAAMLLVDFILSKEGQEILSKAEYFPARPDVPPLEKLSAVVPATAGVHENFVSPENLNKYTDSSGKIWEDLFR
jgi:ABC-type Fe3+ transport system substrate-binding protein